MPLHVYFYTQNLKTPIKLNQPTKLIIKATNYVHIVAGLDGCWGEEEKYQAATMANKAAVRVKGVECSRMKLIIENKSIILITD